MSASGGFWPGEAPQAAEQEDGQEPEATVAEPPRWPQPRGQEEQTEAEPKSKPKQAEVQPAEVPRAAVARPEPAEEEEEEEEPEPEELPEVAPAGHVPGELDIPDGVAVLEGSPSGAERTIGVVVSRFNGEISNRLLESA